MKEVENFFVRNKSIFVLAITLFLLSGCTNNDFSGNNIQDAQDIQSESGVQDVIQDQEVQDTQDLEDQDIIDLEKIEVEEKGTYTSK